MGAAVLVVIGGAVGAPARYLLTEFFKKAAGDGFPWGTLAANLIGTSILGLIVGTAAPDSVDHLFGTGLCGALTTFSTFEKDTVTLMEDGSYAKAGVNAVGSLVIGLLCAELFYAIGRGIT
ncbi:MULTISPECIES: fluoride efflux transporter CrcB [Thermomonosporaceae]|uniref:fluoride efflux transporter CrcB n=1 Tax=Thermomonosporaceae TaxID=2012 RepID=UPI00255AC8ED|nr:MULTISPECIES: fluoride efflux transporter CrcB [Thermomonosporaceae]MDL4775845.1 fluoride efflux transporter CrcB [Actinomadura xylanilytica]